MDDTPGLSQQLDGDLTLYFSPECPIGRQVYTSFSDEELLESPVETMEGRNGSPRPERLLCVYRWYLEKRKYSSEKEKNDVVQSGVLYSSGLIAGEGIVGIILAVLAVIPRGAGYVSDVIDFGAKGISIGSIGGLI